MSPAEHTAPSTEKGANSSNEITIAVSLNALFNLENYSRKKDRKPKQGPAFHFVKTLMVLKNSLEQRDAYNGPLVNIIITIPKAERVDDRLEKIIQLYGQFIRYDNEMDLFSLLKDKNTKLYLSMNPTEVTNAIKQDIAAATLFARGEEPELSESQLRVAFDGDGVIFSDEAETVFKEKGFEAYREHEVEKQNIPLPEGPLKCFLEVLVELQKNWKMKECLIRTYLVTSRDALHSGRRALNTLRSWSLNINEMFFLDGSPKGQILQAVKPHVFFDDQMRHVNSASEAGVIAAHVPYGISQRYH